jgi:hypothetical protein
MNFNVPSELILLRPCAVSHTVRHSFSAHTEMHDEQAELCLRERLGEASQLP